MKKIFPRVMLSAVVLGTLGVAWLLQHHRGRDAAVPASDATGIEVERGEEVQSLTSRVLPSEPQTALPDGTAEPPAVARPRQAVGTFGGTNATAGGVPVQAKPRSSGGKPPPQDPLARIAVAFVGEDPWAEAYWYEAINDPSLPATERQDLIEDLNEDGLPDPKRPTAEDLPLIVSRLTIIEAIAWDAMDEVNAEAFAEAYKDLLNLGAFALGGGEPVR